MDPMSLFESQSFYDSPPKVQVGSFYTPNFIAARNGDVVEFVFTFGYSIHYFPSQFQTLIMLCTEHTASLSQRLMTHAHKLQADLAVGLSQDLLRMIHSHRRHGP